MSMQEIDIDKIVEDTADWMDAAKTEDNDSAQFMETTGLIFNKATNSLLDPETGEVFEVNEVVDRATADRVSWLLYSNEMAISNLEGQIEELQSKLKRRKARGAWLKSKFWPSLGAWVTSALAGKGKNSLSLAWMKVGFRGGRKKIDISGVDESSILAGAVSSGSHAALVLTFDLSYVPGSMASELIKLASRCLGQDPLTKNGASVKLMASRLSDYQAADFIAAVPEAAPDNTPELYASVPNRKPTKFED